MLNSLNSNTPAGISSNLWKLIFLKSLLITASLLESDINKRGICLYSILNLPGRETNRLPDSISPSLFT